MAILVTESSLTDGLQPLILCDTTEFNACVVLIHTVVDGHTVVVLKSPHTTILLLETINQSVQHLL